MSSSYLVIGATGKQGSALVDALLEKKLGKVHTHTHTHTHTHSLSLTH